MGGIEGADERDQISTLLDIITHDTNCCRILGVVRLQHLDIKKVTYEDSPFPGPAVFFTDSVTQIIQAVSSE